MKSVSTKLIFALETDLFNSAQRHLHCDYIFIRNVVIDFILNNIGNVEI